MCINWLCALASHSQKISNGRFFVRLLASRNSFSRMTVNSSLEPFAERRKCANCSRWGHSDFNWTITLKRTLTPRSAANLERNGKFVRQQRLVTCLFIVSDRIAFHCEVELHLPK
jgi:hypothetical protein